MIGFFDIVFLCNEKETCTLCNCKESCNHFQKCFNGALPCEVWRSVTSFTNLVKYIEDWGEYQNEQTTKKN